ncbi:MAG: hypothetical protein ACRD3I_01720, partial [Terriglobales bacterium]
MKNFGADAKMGPPHEPTTVTSVPMELARELKIAPGEAARAAAASRRRDLAAALSLANLCFFRFWHNVLFLTPLLAPIWSWRDLVAIAVNVSGLAGLFWVLMTVGKRSHHFPGWHRGL